MRDMKKSTRELHKKALHFNICSPRLIRLRLDKIPQATHKRNPV
jgi:hypothetical protein